MNYIAILKDNGETCDVVAVTGDFSKSSGITTVTKRKLVTALMSAKLVNASLVNGSIVDNCGKFSRLEKKNGVNPRIILCEMRTEGGELKGYKLLNSAGAIETIRKDVVLKYCESAKQRDASFIQNGVYKEMNGTMCIACYPYKPFEVFVPNLGATVNIKPEVNITKEERTEKQVAKENKSIYTPEQLKEIEKAQSYGVDIRLIENPKLSPGQMRALWVSKYNGALSEYFAHPRYLEEVMQFFGSRIFTKGVLKDSSLLFKTKYSVDQLNELFLGVIDGLNITKFSDNSLTASQMADIREEMLMNTYTDYNFDGSILEKVVEKDYTLDDFDTFLGKIKKH